MSARSVLSLCTLLALSACGLADREVLPPEGQVLLYVDTDAWLEPAPGEAPREDDRPGLFHRLRVEFYVPGQDEPCADCTREFGLDRQTVAQGRASVGFVPRPGVRGYRARVRLFRAAGPGESNAEPRPASTIESVVELPASQHEGITEATVFLATDDVGRVQGSLDAPLAPRAGRPSKSAVGEWHKEVRRGCGSAPRDGEACVPGGAFWMGNPAFYDPVPERLVALSPFFVDRTEMTVASVRASGLVKQTDIVTHSQEATCTFTASPGNGEDMPVNCVSHPLASRVCESRDAALLSEAQFEYLAGALRGWTFPWGVELPTCKDAVFGRDDDAESPPSFRACVSRGTGVARPASGERDHVDVGGGLVTDLAGNLREWVRDAYSPPEGPCWASPAVDPVCTEGDRFLFSIRGGSWKAPNSFDLSSTRRNHTTTQHDGKHNEVGFRCARRAD